MRKKVLFGSFYKTIQEPTEIIVELQLEKQDFQS